ncbi:MAG: hydroxyacid-oxoacid transhydrogenase [Candidatus Dormibacteria bacterium]
MSGAEEALSTEALREETIFTWGAPPLKFGAGAADEIGFEVAQHGLRRVLVLSDPRVVATGVPQRITETLGRYEITAELFDDVHVEPTDASIRAAAAWAREQGPWDGFVAVGGGSVLDTAKAVNLLTTYPGELTDYFNPPVGLGKAPPGPLMPLIAVPTTAGTGSESTAMCVLDVLSLRVKTGISHWRLRPTLAVVDPLLTMTLPPQVTASAGMDILLHALESYTARNFRDFPRKSPEERVTYCGANPVSDVWTERAMALLARSFREAVHRGGENLAARTDVMLAATFAGMGFGSSGVHIPHANGYPIAGRVKSYTPSGYPQEEPMVPHGQSVSLTAPAAFRFTFSSQPERHLRAAELVAPQLEQSSEPSERLPRAVIELMRDIDIPSGIGEVGYGQEDIPDLVGGTMQQQRLLATSPREVTEEDVAQIFAESIENW